MNKILIILIGILVVVSGCNNSYATWWNAQQGYDPSAKYLKEIMEETCIENGWEDECTINSETKEYTEFTCYLDCKVWNYFANENSTLYKPLLNLVREDPIAFKKYPESNCTLAGSNSTDFYMSCGVKNE